jgi:HK97 family phage prohead protease
VGAIAPHSTATSDAAWDGAAAERNLNNTDGAAQYRQVFAWMGDGNPDAKADYSMPHHFVDGAGHPRAASTMACSAIIASLNGARGGTSIPEGDRQGVYDHARKHLVDAGRTPQSIPDLRSSAVAGSMLGAVLPFHGEILVRSFSSDVELSGADRRTLVGRLVPYGEVADVYDIELRRQIRERFTGGAFGRQVRSDQAHRVRLYASHERRLSGEHPLAKVGELTEQRDGLWGAIKLPNTHAADDALELIRSDTVLGFSVGFRTLEGGSVAMPDGVIERRAAHLDHVALTDEPSYPGARVMAIRQAVPEHPAGAELQTFLDSKPVFDLDG